MPIIEVDHVSKEFQLGELESFKTALRNRWRRLRGQPVEHRALFKALDDISFSVEPGEVLGIIGHNGAGKSTLLKLLAGISKPSSGRITTHGRIAPLIEVGAGFVGQLTGRENVYLNGAILGMSKKEIDRKFDEIVDFSELEEFIDTPVKRYSSGMRVKLAFSVATSIEAEILILDEVLAVGDLAFQRKSFDRMEAMIKQDHRTVLLVSHNIRQVERLCDRVIELSHGRVVADGDPATVCNHFVEANNLLIKQAQQKQGAKTERNGTGVELATLELLDSDGRVTDSVRCLDPCSVQVEFTTKVPLRRTTFCIGIHTTDFFYLTADNTAYDPRDFEPGTYIIQLDIRSMVLLPGVYCLLVWIGSDIGETYFSAENIRQFTVTANDYKLTRQRDRAVVKLESTWKLGMSQHIEEVVTG